MEHEAQHPTNTHMMNNTKASEPDVSNDTKVRRVVDIKAAVTLPDVFDDDDLDVRLCRLYN